MNKGFDYKFYTLDSGLRLVTVPMGNTKTVTVLVLVGTGSKYETRDINGISHFLEHMMFKGTSKRPDKLDIARELDGIGAAYNAFTGKEYTGYYAKASSEKMDTVMDVVFDIFLNSKLEEKEIEVEKGVVIEELNMDKDNPMRCVWDMWEELLYGNQPAGWNIGGTKDILMKLKRNQFTDYFNTHYIAQNTIVAVAGNIDHDTVRAKTEEYFKNIRRDKPVTKPAAVQVQSKPEIKLEFRPTDQTHFVLGVRSYHMFDERKYAMSLLGTILGGGMSSRLFDEVREKRGLAYYIRAGSQAYTDTGYFAVSAGVNNEKVYKAIEVIISELKKMATDGVTEQELQRAKDQIDGHTALGLEDSESVAQAYAEPVLFEGKVLTPEQELAKIRAVTVGEIQSAARDIFRSSKLNLAVIGPFKDSAEFAKLLIL